MTGWENICVLAASGATGIYFGLAFRNFRLSMGIAQLLLTIVFVLEKVLL